MPPVILDLRTVMQYISSIPSAPSEDTCLLFFISSACLDQPCTQNKKPLLILPLPRNFALDPQQHDIVMDCKVRKELDHIPGPDRRAVPTADLPFEGPRQYRVGVPNDDSRTWR